MEKIASKINAVYMMVGAWLAELMTSFNAVPVEQFTEEVSGWVLGVSAALTAAWAGVVEAVKKWGE